MKIKWPNSERVWAVVVTFLLVLAVFYFANQFHLYLLNIQNKITKVDIENQSLASKVEDLNQQINSLKTENEITEQVLLTLDQNTQNKINETRNQIISTSAGLEAKIKANTKESLDSVVSKWRTRVVKINCLVETRDGQFQRQGGGTLYKKNNRYFLLTNYHVIGYGSGFNCQIEAPGISASRPLSIEKRSIDPSGIDYVQIELDSNEIDPALGFMTDLDICQTRSPVGREVLILGYPQTGSVEEITVTEGIISAYDNNTYITSAKVDQGNSGGAAIDTSRNCYLGMPSFVTQGFLESLARILDIKIVLP